MSDRDLSASPPLSEQPDVLSVEVVEAYSFDAKDSRENGHKYMHVDLRAIELLCASHERLRSQVSTLTDQLAAVTEGRLCGASAGEDLCTYTCTRPAGHDGDHEDSAHGAAWATRQQEK
jgi:hypothetical protein